MGKESEAENVTKNGQFEFNNGSCKVIEHSKNKIITQSWLFENEIGPGVLQSSAQQTRVL